MLLPRRRPPDPHALARVTALSAPGWVPPPLADDEAQEPEDERPPHRAAAAHPASRRPPVDVEPLALEEPDSALDRWRAARTDPGRRGVAALAAVVALAVVVTAGLVLRSRPQEVPVPAVVPPAAAASAPATRVDEVVVSVGGKVRRPGLVRLPAGSRVDDAVRAAGGARRDRDLELVNLARRLVDGEQLLIGTGPKAAATAAGPGVRAGGAPAPVPESAGLPLDLNAASAAELDALPGLGAVLAERIVAWRTEHGRFGSVEQLREVSGIGESKFAQLRSRVRV